MIVIYFDIFAKLFLNKTEKTKHIILLFNSLVKELFENKIL